MKVVSWNVHRCIGTDGHYRPERIAEVLASLDADLIALQEIDSSLKASNGRDQLTFIASTLGMDAVMGPTLDRDYGAYGNALLAKGSFEGWEEYDLSFRRFEPRGALAVTLIHESRRLRVVNTHFGLKYWERAFQVDRLLADCVWKDAADVLVCGDFNEWCPFTPNNLRLQRVFEASPRLATFPSTWPRFALDRIFLSGSFIKISYEVLRSSLARAASDHLPLIATFDFEGSSADNSQDRV